MWRYLHQTLMTRLVQLYKYKLPKEKVGRVRAVLIKVLTNDDKEDDDKEGDDKKDEDKEDDDKEDDDVHQ